MVALVKESCERRCQGSGWDRSQDWADSCLRITSAAKRVQSRLDAEFSCALDCGHASFLIATLLSTPYLDSPTLSYGDRQKLLLLRSEHDRLKFLEAKLAGAQ